jgi:hypothetical protein
MKSLDVLIDRSANGMGYLEPPKSVQNVYDRVFRSTEDVKLCISPKSELSTKEA